MDYNPRLLGCFGYLSRSIQCMENFGDESTDRVTGNQIIQNDDARFFLATIIDTLQDSVVTVNLDGVITSWNKSAEHIYGYPASEAIGKSLELVILPEDFSTFLGKIETIRTGHTMPLYDTVRIDKHGRSIHLEITLSPVLNHDGAVIGISTVARDISELRSAQDALFASETRLRAIVHAAIDFAIIPLDEHGHITDWNSGAEKMFGYTREEVLGRHTEIIFTPEDRHGRIAEVEIEVARTTGRSIDERWHLHKNGTRFFMSGVMTPIGATPKEGYLKVARDITDRRMAEEALQFSEQQRNVAVQSAAMGEWEWELAKGIVNLSEQATVLFGWPKQPKELLIGELLERVYQPDRSAVEQQLQLALNGLYIFQTECRIVRSDNNQVVWVSAYGRVVGHVADKPSKMIGVVYDITQRKLLEKQKDDFISSASHELKTPVTAIKSYSDILEENLQETKEDGNLDLLLKMNGQVDRLIRLIQILLDSSNLSEGKLQLHPQPVDLNALIDEQMDSLQFSAGSRKLHFRRLPVSIVHADRERIIQVVTNFVTNAIKYTPENTEIIITTSDELQSAMVRVQDFGAGIPPESQPYLFDRYYRVPGEQSSRQSGFGLGLYICSEIIKHHHGTIGVESVVGEGSTFFFTLPYT